MEEASTGSGPFFSQLINLGLPWKSVYGQLPPPAPISFRPSPKHGVVIFLPLYLSNIWNRKAKSPKSISRLCIFLFPASPSQTGSAQRSFFQIFIFNPSLSLGPKTKDSILKFISNLFMLTKLYTVLYRLRKRYCVLIVLPLKQLNSRQLIISNNEHFPRKSPFLWNSITWWTFKNLLEKKISPIGLLNRRQLNSFQFYFGEHQRCCTEHNKR